jgi:hypothetical protein
MSNGAFAFFAITLGAISVVLAALLVCMIMQENFSVASASPLLKQATYRSSSLDDRAFCLSVVRFLKA